MAYDYIVSTGIIVPDTATIYDDVVQEIKDAFGDDVVTTPDSPAGVIATGETLARTNTAETIALVANQFNPDYAGGTFLDSIWALTGGQRTVATSTTVIVTLTGVDGTTIPSGTLAKTTNEDIFESISEVVIPLSGTIDTTFRSVVKGAIPCTVGSLTEIVTEILGWETITNSTDGTIGRDTQSDVEARELRKLTLALIGRSTVEAITSELYALDDVKSLQFRENIASTSETIDNVLMSPHSIYLCVDGGSDEEIATTLLNNKTLGAGYNGNESVTVVEPNSGQSYTVKFDRPDEVLIQVKISVKVVSSVVAPIQFIKDSILNYANSTLKQEGFKVGNNVSPSEIGASVAIQTGFFVADVQITKQSVGVFDRVEIPIEIFEKATITENLIEVILI